jgi:hypothetical protein
MAWYNQPLNRQIAQYIYNGAQARGLDPNFVLGIATHEGLNRLNPLASNPDPSNSGAPGRSFGVFQDRTPGLADQLGLSPSASWQSNVDANLNFMAANPGRINATWASVNVQGGVAAITAKGAADAQRLGINTGDSGGAAPDATTSGMDNYSNPGQSYALPPGTDTAPMGDPGSTGGTTPEAASTDPNALIQSAPGPLGDILGFNDPSQSYTLPSGVATAGATASSDTASGDMTIPQAIDKQATVESKAIASAATSQDKTAQALAKAALQSAQSIAQGQQASAKEQTSSQEQSSQGLLNQVKDMFVRFFLGAGGLVLIAAAVWYFAGKPTPSVPVKAHA